MLTRKRYVTFRSLQIIILVHSIVLGFCSTAESQLIAGTDPLSEPEYFAERYECEIVCGEAAAIDKSVEVTFRPRPISVYAPATSKYFLLNEDIAAELTSEPTVDAADGLLSNILIDQPKVVEVTWFDYSVSGGGYRTITHHGKGYSIRCHGEIEAAIDLEPGEYTITIGLPKVREIVESSEITASTSSIEFPIRVWKSRENRLAVIDAERKEKSDREFHEKLSKIGISLLAIFVLALIGFGVYKLLRPGKGATSLGGSIRIGLGWTFVAIALLSLFTIPFYNGFINGNNLINPRGDSASGGVPWLVAMGIAALAVIGRILIVVGRKVKAVGMIDVIARDPREPIVYLRSFDDDGTKSPRRSGLWLGPNRTIEESLCSSVASVGPMVATGRPGETFPELGAARMYVQDKEEWTEKVSALLDGCRAAVLRAGTSAGLLWEIEYVVQTLSPEKVFILLAMPHGGAEKSVVGIVSDGANRISGGKNFTRQELYQIFRESAARLLPKGLPESIGGAAFIRFDEQWNPILMDGTSVRSDDPMQIALGKLSRQFAPRSVAKQVATGIGWGCGGIIVAIVLGACAIAVLVNFG